jgi:hypothetical protein
MVGMGIMGMNCWGMSCDGEICLLNFYQYWKHPLSPLSLG